ncbi:MAG: tetratricopeptide repeat protein [Crocinitomicaceae bacterium]|nr:tetratricopeptide repeat protein [Crocinitomicaceae bacterium]
MLRSKLPYILILSLSIRTFTAVSQVSYVDSLRTVWEDTNHPDSVRMPALANLIWAGYVYSDPDSAYLLTNELKNLAKKNNNAKMMIVSLNAYGVIKTLTGDYDSAMYYFKECEMVSKQTGHSEDQATSIMNIGNVFRMKGNLAEAIINYNSARKIYESLEMIDRVLQIYTNISLVYSDQKDFKMAQEYLKKGEALINEGYGDKQAAIYNYYNQGVNYNNREIPDSAILYLEKTKVLAESMNNEIMLLHTYVAMGSAYRTVDDGLALDYFNNALTKGKELNDVQAISTTNFHLADVFLKQGKMDLAITHAKQSLEIAEELEMLFNMNEASQILYQAYKAKGNTANALEYYEKFILYRDSLEGESNQKEIINQEYKFEYEKKAAADSVKAAEESKIQAALLKAEKSENQKRKQQSYFLIGGLLIAIIFGIVVFNRFKITNKQKVVIEEQKNEIIDSIRYAKRIQSAILPPDKVVKANLENSFILYKPKDIVAGDFYWMQTTGNKIIFAAADCTGHGVPGALVSVVCHNALNRSVKEFNLIDPADILDKTRELVVTEFQKSDEEVKDGMDIALCVLDDLKLQYAGAHNPLWIIRNSDFDSNLGVHKEEGSEWQLLEIKADKQPIGITHEPKSFTAHSVQLKTNDRIFVFSDGFSDQFGGDQGKKFKTKAFKQLLLSIQHLDMEAQKKEIDRAFEEWKGDIEQLDDVCIIGVRV